MLTKGPRPPVNQCFSIEAPPYTEYIVLLKHLICHLCIQNDQICIIGCIEITYMIITYQQIKDKGDMLMKKFSKVIVALVTILVLGLVATGCSCSNSNKNNTNSTD